MSFRAVFVFALILFSALNFGQCSADDKKSNIGVITVSSMAEFLKENPGVKLTPLTRKTFRKGFSPYLQTQYSFGQRIPGDHILATDSASQQWSTPQDVTKNLFYPQQGIGAVVTYLQIIVNQSTNIGQASIVSGGIGQRQISVVIVAKSTLYFSYQASIYGY